MNMKRMVMVGFLGLAAVGLAACGSSSSGSSSSTPEITTVDQLPRATSPVVSSGSGSISQPKGMGAKATTGIVLGELSNSTFEQGQSMGLCEAANHVREAIGAAAQADLILCYVQNIVAADSSGQLSTIYDGNYHSFGLNISGAEEGSPDHVKMRITKSGNVITGFEMFACASGSQQEYLSQTISGTELSMVGKGIFTSQQGTGRHSVEVTGTLNSTGYFTSKTITLDNYGTWSNYLSWNEASVTQYADKLIYDGYDAGGFSGGSFSNRIYAQTQLIDPNSSASNSSYDIGLIAVGDGAANTYLKNVFNSQIWEPGYSDGGWNGDSKLDDDAVVLPGTNTTWLSQVENTQPTAAATSHPTIEFTASQTYTCDGTEEVQVTANETTLATACDKFNLGHNWVDCYNTIQPSNP